jgi:hypothetical protein
MKPSAFIVCLAGLLHGYAPPAPLSLAVATQLDANFPAVENLYQQAARKAGQPLRVNRSPEWAADLKPTVTATIKAELAILLDLMAPSR